MHAAIDYARDIITFFRRSPKRLAIVEELSQQTNESCTKLKALCPTRWTIRAAAMRCLLKNYGHRKLFLVDISMILNCICCFTSARRAWFHWPWEDQVESYSKRLFGADAWFQVLLRPEPSSNGVWCYRASFDGDATRWYEPSRHSLLGEHRFAILRTSAEWVIRLTYEPDCFHLPQMNWIANNSTTKSLNSHYCSPKRLGYRESDDDRRVSRPTQHLRMNHLLSTISTSSDITRRSTSSSTL